MPAARPFIAASPLLVRDVIVDASARRMKGRFLRGQLALHFLRFWRQSRDAFHLLFAGSFLMLAGQRVLLALLPDTAEEFPAAYLPRVAAYLLIIVAVAWKNRRGAGGG